MEESSQGWGEAQPTSGLGSAGPAGAEEHFRALADPAPFLIWISLQQADAPPSVAERARTSDLPAGRTWFNRCWLELVGQPLERQLGNGWLNDVHPDDAQGCRETCEAECAARRSFSMEYRLRRRDGTWRWILDSGAPHWLPDGSFAGYLGSGVDITERRSSADAVRESQVRYQTLAESLPHLVWTCNPDGWCDYLSRQWVEYTGRPESEQLGYGWAEHLHPEDRERTRQEWTNATVRGDKFDVEFRLRRRDGAYRWFKTRAVPLRDLSGHIIKWFGSNTDFDDHKRTEQRLETQLERMSLLDRITRAIGQRQDLSSTFEVLLRSLEESLPLDFACVCLPSESGEFLTVAAVGRRGVGRADPVGLRESARVAVDENGLSRCLRGQLVYEPNTTQVHFPFAQRLASAGLHALVLAPMSVESQVFGILIAARTEPDAFASADCEFLRQLGDQVGLAAHQSQLYGALQQAYEDLRQSQESAMQHERLRALGQMAGGIAHNINNAISPVALYTEWLLEQEPALSVRARDYLRTIQRAIADVALTVTGMREFYRQREPQLPYSPVDLNEVVRQAVDLTRARWSDMPQQRGVVIQMQLLLSAESVAFLGVAGEIREALTNLIFNAVDAMPEGGTLTLRTFTRKELLPGAPAALEAVLEVSDDGIGMTEDLRQRCFEPFVTTKGERGTGLGLALVYGVVQRHSASIELESQPHAGTTVRLQFPVAERAPAASIAAEPAPRSATQLDILLVDDDPLVIKSLRDMLASDGHCVTTAEGGQAGIAAFHAAQQRSKPFALVITDLGMPYVDGRKVASAVKAAAPATPVILLTGWGQRMAAEGGAPLHVDVVLSKPPKLRLLRDTVASLCQRAAAAPLTGAAQCR
ncbi:MAG: hypothetical protein RL685_1697 [Pseudomonadota bacterium]